MARTDRALACGCDDYATKPIDFPGCSTRSGLLNRMSLRRRLTLSLFTILVLFAINVGTHFWGSYARSESMVAYRQAVSAGQLSDELAKQLEDQRQKILVLSTLRDNTDDPWHRRPALRPWRIAGDPRHRRRRWAHGQRRHGAAVRAPARQQRTPAGQLGGFYRELQRRVLGPRMWMIPSPTSRPASASRNWSSARCSSPCSAPTSSTAPSP
jgi:hypothetical protein